MCGTDSDDPSMHDEPVMTSPRVYTLSGAAPAPAEPRPSIALAVIGDLLELYEREEAASIKGSCWWETRVAVVDTLRMVRNRIAEAEAAQ